MASVEDLPLEVLDKIFSTLDRDSVIASTNVCLSWRKVIHKLTNIPATKSTPALQYKIKKCGWILEDHDVENCKCIELNTYLFKFIDNKSFSSCELFKGRTRNERYCFTILKTKFFFCNKENNISIIDLSQPCSERTDLFEQSEFSESEQMRRNLFSVRQKVTLMLAHDKTLVTAIDEWYDSSLKNEYHEWLQGNTFDFESHSDSEEKEDIMYYRERRIIIWNHETLHYVCGVKVLEKLNEFTSHNSDGEDFEVQHFAMAGGKLVVNIAVTYEDLPRLKRDYTQIWKLDTENPSLDNLHYLTTIDHDWREDEGYVIDMFLNSKILGFAIHKHNEEILLSVFVFINDDVSYRASTVVGEILDCDILFDANFSNNFAVFNNKRNLLNVYKFDGTSLGINLVIDLSNIVCKDSDDLLIANYMMGKIMLFHKSDSQFQSIIVNEDGEVIEGTRQTFQEGEVRIRGATFCADGIVVKAKDQENSIAWLNYGRTIISFYYPN